MENTLSVAMKNALTEKLLDSLHGPIPNGTPRMLFGKVDFPNKANAIIGMRRAGKTYLLHQIRRNRLASGTPRELLPCIDFEDERLVGLQASQLGFLLEELRRQFPEVSRQGVTVWCFDEIQVVQGWERFVRRLLDEGGCEVFVSGSSANMLSREIATSLRGRGWEVPLYPFSFAESMLYHEIALPKTPRAMSSRQRTTIEGAFSKWLVVGGFPEAQDLEQQSRHELLTNYVNIAMYRDVIERHNVSNVVALRWLVRHLLGNAGSLFSIDKFYATLKSQKISISKDTLHNFLPYLEDCFLVRIISIETSSERKRMVNPRKSYPVDAGLIPVFDRSGKANIGHAFETAVLIELERRRCKATYVRTQSGYEVDFMSRNPLGEQELIQVCVDASDYETAKRELRALEEAGEEFPNAKKRLLVLRQDCFPSQAPEDVLVQPAYEWMLDVEYVHAYL